MKIKKKFYHRFSLLLIILLTCFVSILLAIKTFGGLEKKVLGNKVAVFDKESFSFQPNGDLKYFYEPNPNTKEVWRPDWLGKSVVNTINSDSLNERYEYPVIKDKGRFRIITLGDSYTYGHFVETSQNYSEVLEDFLNEGLSCPNIKKFEVINLGYPGYDTTYQVERFIKRGVKYNPDLLIWALNRWNLETISEELLPLQEKLNQTGNSDYFDPISKTRPYVEQAFQIIKSKLGDEYIVSYQKMAFSRLASNYNGKILLLSFPSFTPREKKIVDEFLSTNPSASFEELVNFADDKSLRLVDEHPSPKGHKVIAEEIFNILLKNYLPECSAKKLPITK